MKPVAQAEWESAATRLLGDVYVFAATGPRVHSDWQSDAIAVMNREVADPRGWIKLDWDNEGADGRADEVPPYPFVSLARDLLNERTRRVTHQTARTLVAVMSYEWGELESEGPSDAACADAATLLGRYGSDAAFFSNISRVEESMEPDLTASGFGGWIPLTSFIGDCGVVAVSDEEVGVFWSFDAR